MKGSDEIDNGRMDGEEWARDFAEGMTSEQLDVNRQVTVSDHGLRNLQAWCDRLTGLDDPNLLELVKSADRVFFVIHPDRDGDSQAAAEFWDNVTTSEMTSDDPRPTAEVTSPSYLTGFIDGAMEFWRKRRNGGGAA